MAGGRQPVDMSFMLVISALDAVPQGVWKQGTGVMAVKLRK
jgi:hypothetical protein